MTETSCVFLDFSITGEYATFVLEIRKVNTQKRKEAMIDVNILHSTVSISAIAINLQM